MNIEEVVEMIKNDKKCKVYDICGSPILKKGDILPEDIKQFYELCGGVDFFYGSEYEIIVVPPTEIVLANPLIIGELCDEDISSKWYVICKDAEDNYITFDSSIKRNGKCYDSFWDRHGVVGECAIVANSFTELLYNIYKSKGQELYWLSNDFDYIGDAYDSSELR